MLKNWVTRTIYTRNNLEYLWCSVFQTRDHYVLYETKLIKTNPVIVLFYKGNSIENYVDGVLFGGVYKW